jgi:hypothetical protein
MISCLTIAAAESPAAPNFFTINLLKRRADLLTRDIDALREAVRRTRANKPFDIESAAERLPDADIKGRTIFEHIGSEHDVALLRGCRTIITKLPYPRIRKWKLKLPN